MVSPDIDGGEQPAAGKVRIADADTIVLGRTADNVGTICVHYPMAGYRIALIQSQAARSINESVFQGSTTR